MLISNKIAFYNTGSGAYNLSEVIKKLDSALNDFSKAVANSKYLFSVEHYNYLESLIYEIELLFIEHKKIYFNLIYIQILANDGNKEAQQKLFTINIWVKDVAKGGDIPEKNLFEILDVNYEQYAKRQQKIIEKFSNKKFFATFDEYLNVKKV